MGNFTCTCKSGYKGDGINCDGKYQLVFFLQILNKHARNGVSVS